MADVTSTYGSAPATYPDMLTAVNNTNAMASVTTKHILEGKSQVHTVAGGLVRPASGDVSALYHRVIRQVAGARGSMQRNQPGAQHNLRLLPLADSWLEVRDIEVYGVVDMFGNTGSGADQIWERSLIHGNRDGWTGNPAFCCASDRGTGHRNVYRNLCLYDSYTGWWSGSNTGATQKVHNLSILQCTYGVYQSKTDASTEYRNFLVGGSVTADYQLGGGAWPTRSNNQSADASGDVGYQNKAIANEVLNSTRYSEDAVLKAGAAAILAGMDLSLVFPDDYFQTLRVAGMWDIGAYAYSTTPPPSLITRLSMPAETAKLLEMGAEQGWDLEMPAETSYDLDMEAAL